jgi:hypothetical protein
MPIKSFRGLMTTGDIVTIPLSTNKGSIGYIIKKFKVMSNTPGDADYENVFKIYSIPQTTATGSVDFSDNTLLGAAYEKEQANTTSPYETSIVFDNMTFNQDIYVTLAGGASDKSNYYIELEQVKLDLNENTVATLKDIRNIAGQ